MKAIRVHGYGGPEVLRWEEIDTPEPGPREALIEIEVAGVNFIDTYHRTGLYPVDLPATLGVEGAGRVQAVGDAVDNVRVGDRVAYAMTMGSYAQYAVVPAWRLVPVPPEMKLASAAAAMVQGMTAHYLTHSTFPLSRGQSALVHAAAGGVGLFLIQIARILGARVIGTVSTREKAERARAAGADETVLYTEVDFESEVKRLTGGEGVEVVYDSVGKTTFEQSLRCLKPRGYLVLFGQSSGPVPPLDPQILSAQGSVFLTRPTLAHYAADPEELSWRAGDLLRWINEGQIRVQIDRTYPLAAAAQAHVALEGRETSGKVLLLHQ